MKRSKIFISPFYLSAMITILSPTYAGSMASESYAADSWTVGASALGLQPTLANQFVYAMENTIIPPVTTTHALNPKFHWGFDVFLRRNFNQTGRDLSISYMGFRSSATNTVNVPLSSNFIYTDFYQTAQGTNKININVGDVLVGQNVIFNDAVRVHGVLGVAYANLLIRNITTNDQGLGIVTNVASESYIYRPNTFHGAGPKVGVDGEYMINNNYHLGLTGGFSAAFLVGSQHITTTSTNGNTNMNAVTTNITNINGNIGIRHHANTGIPIDAEVGYKVYDYINDISLAGVYLSLAATFG